jgi:O-antigen/teichoic acid export membrane protein
LNQVARISIPEHSLSNITSIAQPARTNTDKIAKNFAWNGLDLLLSTVGMVIVSVAVARVLGPTRLGHFNLIYWTTSITGLVGSLGVPATTFKYMGEFLGAGRNDLARGTFFYSLKLQAFIGLGISAAGLLLVLTIGDPAYRLVSVLLVVSILPQMLTFIPSQANSAAENTAANVRGSQAGALVNLCGVLLSLGLHWDLVGIAVTILTYRVVELMVKLVPVWRRLNGCPPGLLPAEVKERMFSYSGYSTGLMLLQVVVLDRSDIVLLKLLQPDIRQIAFFSIAFSLADRLLRVPQAFGSAVSYTQMAEYGRDRERLFRLTGVAGTYSLLMAAPLLLGAACISGPLFTFFYGAKYLPAVPVFMIVAVFAISKAVLAPAQNLLYSAEDLSFLLKWLFVCGVVNVAIDFALIPHHGAWGAAIGNGVAQTTIAVAVWGRALRKYRVQPSVVALSKIILAALVMCLVVILMVTGPFPMPVKLFVAPIGGMATFVCLLRGMSVLSKEDRARLVAVGRLSPFPLRGWFQHLTDSAVPPTVIQSSRET